VTKDATFPPDEQPTEPTSIAAQAAILVANFKAMTPARHQRILRYSAALAALPSEAPCPAKPR